MATQRLRLLEETTQLEESLTDFVRGAWSSVDATEYQDSWAIDALCEHLTAVTLGHIPRLLINFPPRCGKSKVASIIWPAWTWAQTERTYLSGPNVEFLCGSYNHGLALENSNQTRRLILSPWYQKRWGSRFTLRDDQNTKTKFDNTEGGSRIATSVGGSLLGIGGNVVLIDDPHNTEDVESDADRQRALNWWREISSTRLNDPKRSAIVVIMQRLHEEDVSGVIAKSEDYENWTHLMLPMRHDSRRHCVTVIAPDYEWEDPRKEHGELLWPERFGEKEVSALEKALGPYMASGRLQQSPTPTGGGIIKDEMWLGWDKPRYPDCQYVLASLDTAYTAKEENDASALTIWGVFAGEDGAPKVVLLYAWEGRLELHDLVTLTGLICTTDKRPDEEIEAGLALFNRGEVAASSLYRLAVDRLLIENKASGISVAQELERLFTGKFAVEFFDPKKWGDKVARLVAVEPMFADGMVYVPVNPDTGREYRWAERVVENVAQAPKTTKWDTPDSVSMALRYLRVTGLLMRKEEHARDVSEQLAYRPKQRPLYAG